MQVAFTGYAQKISEEHRDQIAAQNRPCGAAVRAAKEAGTISTGGNSYGDLGSLSDSEFASRKDEIFAAAKASQLR